MAWITDKLFGLNQGDREARENFARIQADIAAKVEEKAKRGEITRAAADAELARLSGSIESAGAVGLGALGPAYAEELAALPQRVGVVAGKVVGGAGGGFFGNIGGGGALLLLLAVGVWAFTLGPLKGYRLKA